MSIFQVEIIKSGLQTLIANQMYCISDGTQIYVNPLDNSSAILANQLVGNDEQSPVFEMTGIGGYIRVSEGCTIAITGGDLQAKIGDYILPRNETIRLKKSNIVRFSHAIEGFRVYLALSGRFILGDCIQVNSKNHIALSPGFKLNIEPKIVKSKKNFHRLNFPKLDKILTIPVAKGPELDTVPLVAQQNFLNKLFRISRHSVREYLLLESDDWNYKFDSITCCHKTEKGAILISSTDQLTVQMDINHHWTCSKRYIFQIIPQLIDYISQCPPHTLLRFQLQS